VQVCSNLAIRPAEGGSKDMSLQLGRLISSVILLRDVLRIVPVMADSMAWVDSALLKVRLAVQQGCSLSHIAVHYTAITEHASEGPAVHHSLVAVLSSHSHVLRHCCGGWPQVNVTWV
jgi:hypothetical protein